MQYRQRRTELRAGLLLIELNEMIEDVSALNRNTPQAHVELAENNVHTDASPHRTTPQSV